MGILNWLGMGAELAKPIDAVSNLYTTDKARIEAETELQKAINPTIQGQQAINQTYANKTNLFESAWQPLIGWTSGGCVALYYVPQLLIANYVWGLNCIHSSKIEPFPIDPTDILNLVYLLFGFGSYHLIKGRLLR